MPLKKKNPIEEIEEELEKGYQRNAQILILLFLTLSLFFLTFQSYLAEPRELTTVLEDTWEMWFFYFPLFYIISRKKSKDLLFFGLIFLVLGLALAFFEFPFFIKKQYGTLAFIIGIWFLGEWYNLKKFKRSILSDLLKGNYYLAFGIFISSVVLGAAVELVNAPLRLWWYYYPFPSLEINGLPIFMVVFGWFPWILGILVFLYPLAFRRVKERNKRLDKKSKW